eukprot:gnl/TRDRNA2_/TRDRNA2_161182_c0_seq3.p1 gnl/TRDRNA2_/TRDRNA2_161182_c0~~gnl/TRDRNA2_/TRDRNA2_161182_c0_seq3.p1  ORF type:complete len:232 (-),score=42.72 gnl/TRDRNA2_/TRDRNA2_161182_c0_seq3:42-737(-)
MDNREPAPLGSPSRSAAEFQSVQQRPHFCSLDDGSDGGAGSTPSTPSDLEGLYAFEGQAKDSSERWRELESKAHAADAEAAALWERNRLLEAASRAAPERGKERRRDRDLIKDDRIDLKARLLREPLTSSGNTLKSWQSQDLRKQQDPWKDLRCGTKQLEKLAAAGTSAGRNAECRSGTPVPTGKPQARQRPSSAADRDELLGARGDVLAGMPSFLPPGRVVGGLGRRKAK